LKEIIDDQVDLFYFLDDIFQANCEEICRLLANALLAYAIMPGVLAGMTAHKKVHSFYARH
jgi:hypothetical protein